MWQDRVAPEKQSLHCLPATHDNWSKCCKGEVTLMGICTDCGKEYTTKSQRGMCTTCYSRWWRSNNYERNRETGRRSDSLRQAKKDLARMEYYQAHKEEFEAKAEQQALTTRENILQSKRNWYYNNKEHAQAKHKEWLDANKDKVKQYEVEHVVERRGYVEDRRARLMAAKTTLTGGGWRVLLWLYDNTCVYCMKQFDNLEQDHVMPLSRGGSHTPHNVVPACLPCNRKKGTNVILPEHPMWWAIVEYQTRNSESPALPA